MPKRGAVGGVSEKAAAKKEADDDPVNENKFKRVMAWGTPRLVTNTKNRQVNMT